MDRAHETHDSRAVPPSLDELESRRAHDSQDSCVSVLLRLRGPERASSRAREKGQHGREVLVEAPWPRSVLEGSTARS